MNTNNLPIFNNVPVDLYHRSMSYADIMHMVLDTKDIVLPNYLDATYITTENGQLMADAISAGFQMSPIFFVHNVSTNKTPITLANANLLGVISCMLGALPSQLHQRKLRLLPLNVVCLTVASSAEQTNLVSTLNKFYK
ncbi:hypothetical protein MA9V2_129 [Chryseobacterium phage MA9V-2]|nr:hypothetical protein MA9V2_129 [Chryseobacterium phage MA9V-2]